MKESTRGLISLYITARQWIGLDTLTIPRAHAESMHNELSIRGQIFEIHFSFAGVR